MNVINIKLEDLQPYEKNPRNNKEAVDYVANSIKEFGFKVPLVIDKENVIVCGHTRYLACKKLGIEEVPCVVADDLTEEQIKAYRLADNKVSEIATWDYELLNQELDDILGFDMSLYGFNDDEGIELDIEHEVKEDAESIKTQKYLTCGEYKIPVTEEEQRMFNEKIEEYLNDYGTTYGFVRKVFEWNFTKAIL